MRRLTPDEDAKLSKSNDFDCVPFDFDVADAVGGGIKASRTTPEYFSLDCIVRLDPARWNSNVMGSDANTSHVKRSLVVTMN